MSNILLALYNGIYDKEEPEKLPCWYDGFLKGLKKNGHSVFLWQIKEFGTKETILTNEDRISIKEFNPELCIAFNNVLPDVSKITDCPVVTIIVDSAKYLSNVKLLKNRLVGTIQEADIRYLHENYECQMENIFLYSPYTEIHPDKAILPTMNISFIGTRFGVPRNAEIGAFAKNDVELREYIRCVEYIKRNPIVSEEQVIRECHVTCREVIEKIDVADIISLLSAEKRIRTLSTIVDLGLKLYGTRSWLERYHFDSRLNMSFVDKEIFSLEQNQDIYNHSKIGINVSHIQAVDAFPWRIVDIMSSNACLVTDWHDGFKKYFNGLKIPIYKDEHEAREICKELLKDERARKQIVDECNIYTREKFSLDIFLKQLYEVTGVVLT